MPPRPDEPSADPLADPRATGHSNRTVALVVVLVALALGAAFLAWIVVSAR